jgi:hypothetical protein
MRPQQEGFDDRYSPAMAKKAWRSSKAKSLLTGDLVDGTIPLENEEMDAHDVYLSRVEFTDFPFESFRSNLRTLRKKIAEKRLLALEENEALDHDRHLFPKSVYNQLGQPRWEGSDAERLLKLDIDQGYHLIQTPRELWGSRAEYQVFTSKVFRKHIYQEVRSRKFRSYISSKKATGQ